MHQPIHDSTEAALLEAMSNWAWWEQTCEYWREQCQEAQRQRDLAYSRTQWLGKITQILDLATKRGCEASVSVTYDDQGQPQYGGTVSGSSFWDNLWRHHDQDRVLSDMIAWLEREPKV